MIHICKKCGKEFEDERKLAAVCFECRSAVCVVCGTRFIPSNKIQYTCSQKCSGIRKSQLGIAAKAAATKPTKTKICKFCGAEFLPRTYRQIYCDGPHYKPCPVCGKLVQIATPSDPAVACSPECQQKKTQATCLAKYGNVNVLNSEHGRSVAKQHCQEKYGTDCPQQVPEFRQKASATMIARYGVAHALQNPEILTQMQQTNLERYGSEWTMCNADVKAKAAKTFEERYGGTGMASPELRARIEATNIVRYNAPCPFGNAEVRQKSKQTLIDRYGVDVAAHIEGLPERRRQTSLERYGTPNPMQSEAIKARLRESLQRKYGVNNMMELPDYVEKSQDHLRAAMLAKYGHEFSIHVPEIRQKITNTIQERYGVPWYIMSPDFVHTPPNVISSVNLAFQDRLIKQGTECTLEFSLPYKKDGVRHRFIYDLRLTASNVLIELDPTYTHNSAYNHWESPLPEDYHQRKSQVAVDAGYRCIHVFEWDDWEAILRLVMPAQRIHGRLCTVQQVSQKEANDFTQSYHLQGKCRGQVINYGLYWEGQLVEVMTFGKPRYAKKYDLELLRLCTVPGLRVVGGASKLFHACIHDHPSESIISYCNLAKFTGQVYEQIGMKLDHISDPAKIWSKKDQFITDNLLRQRGFDQIFGTSYGKGTNNEELMLADGWLPVFDCGQAVYVYQRP